MRPISSGQHLRAHPAAAFAIKERIYGNRIVLFAPLYIANYCVNNCRYCAFRQGNKHLEVRGMPGMPGCTAARTSTPLQQQLQQAAEAAKGFDGSIDDVPGDVLLTAPSSNVGPGGVSSLHISPPCQPPTHCPAALRPLRGPAA